MDRARVLCPSLSFATHACGAALLLLAPLALPDRLPSAPAHALTGVSIDSALLLGGGAPAGGGLPRAVRLPRRDNPARFAAPRFVSPVVPEPGEIDPGTGGSAVPGLPDGSGDGSGGVGVCLVDCGTGPGPAAVSIAALAPPVAPTKPLRIGGDLRPPRKLRHVAPVYPPLAAAARVGGRVVLDCVIDEHGRVADVTVVRGHPLLDAAEMEAVQQWRYLPTLLNGVRVSVLLTVTIDFGLR